MKQSILLTTTTLLFSWQMQGFTSDTKAIGTKIWCYENGWKNNFNYKSFPQISTIKGGEACWVYNKIASSSTKKDTFNWQEGWNFVTPIYKDWNLDDKFRGNALIGWRYEEGTWKVYNYNYKEKFNNLKISDGMFVYIPKIDIKINTQPLFCKNGKCSQIITSNKEYKFYIKSPKNVKLALDLYRYSNKTHYKIAIGPTKDLTSNIPVCVEKNGIGKCDQINNQKESFITYQNGYLVFDAQKVAAHFNKSIPNIKEKFLVKFYIEGFDLPNFVKDEFGTLGIENFGVWVSLKNSKSIEFEMEIR